jgi:hypothetical protein
MGGMGGTAWIEDDDGVWHRCAAPLAPTRRRGPCGQELDLGRLRFWSVRPGEPEPARDIRCPACEAAARAERQ